MTLEELIAAAVSLTVLYAKKIAAGLADRAAKGTEQAAAEHLGRLRAWMVTRLHGHGAESAVEQLGVSPVARGLVRQQLAEALHADPRAAGELEALVVPARAAVLNGGFLSPAAQLPVPRQLPPVPGDFTGRDRERHLLEAELSSPSGSRVCLIHGPGGIGKTVTALQVAHRLAAVFPDGQLFADLRGADPVPAAPDEVLSTFLRSLGVSPEAIPDTPEGRTGLFRSELAARRVLLLLDNAADEEQVRPLLPGTGQCATLITSRTPLAVLAVTQRTLLAALTEQEAWDLLGRICGTERIAAEADAGREVIRLCGGLPLALRVAGARLAAFPTRPVSRLTRDLTDERGRLDVMSFGDATVRSVFQTSYQACSAQQQQAFRLLSALETPSLPAWALAPLLGVDSATAAACLDRLLLIHLVEAHQPEAGSERIVLHDLARLFSRELSTQRPQAEADAAVQRLLGAYLAAADTADAALRPAGRRHTGRNGATRYPPPSGALPDTATDAIRWFDVERGVLLAAVKHAHAAGWWDLCWEITDAMSVSLEHQWRWQESRQAHLLALDAAGRLADGGARAALLRNMGEALRDGGTDLQGAESCFTEAIGLFRDLGDDYGLSDALGNLAILRRQQGRLRESADGLATAEDIFRSLPLERGLAWTLREQAVIGRHRGEYASALGKLDRAAALFTANDEPRGVAWVLRTRADTEAESITRGCPLPRRWYDGPWPGQLPARPTDDPLWAQARAHYADAELIMEEVGDHRARTWAFLGRAEMALHDGDRRTATGLVQQARLRSESHSDHRALGRALTVRALLRAEEKNLDEAISLAESAVSIHRHLLPDQVGEAVAALRLARLYGAAQRHRNLLTTLERAHTLYQATEMPFPQAPADVLLEALAQPIPKPPRHRFRLF
ncbi:NB-ARC domain-containing protein [Streptomyces sp. NBC_01549]|uniref:NB-ARC domain-containing protein n=1 Tax=Streptomyces sp. NBC_01549 TaxID=2975874 RepID=UPI00225ADF6B|nr:tetratricopeptide repeat protein [Streptomyces sp. NBC_01549]MCX4594222.1 NB-ARC domain-containing protein [Streptomyces sp. NBC_01549]